MQNQKVAYKAEQDEDIDYDIYNITVTEEFLEDDEISAEEEAFMAGYNEINN